MPLAKKLRKITVMLPEELVARATEASGEGITPTIRKGLEKIVIAHACEELLKLRGTYKFSLDIDELRED
ncbi:MAG: hypothetical protein ACR2I2_23555 [Bryobacteraceae bacterium]